MRTHLAVGFLVALGCNPSTPVTSGDAGGEGGTDTDCVDPIGAGTMHGSSVTSDETWSAAASPHLLPYDTTISAKVTLEPCAIVAIGAGKTVTVSGPNAAILAQGTDRKPIGITQKDAGKPWSSIRALQGGTLSFTWTGVLGGGDPLNTSPDLAAALDIRADQTMPAAEVLHADHLLVQDSASQGIRIHESGSFSKTSTGIVIKGSKGYPMFAVARLAGDIPDGNYTGNGKDEILIEGSDAYSSVSLDVTFHDRGVPYHIGGTGSSGRLDVGSGKMGVVATLTIEPNVELRFKKGGALNVETVSADQASTGALVAVGTQDAKIRFTSGESPQAAGDWLGVHFHSNIDPSTKMDQTIVEFAGGATTGTGGCTYPNQPINNAAIRILSAKEPPSVFVTNTLVKDSAGHAFDRGWLGDNAPTYIVPGNDFVGIARCKETLPRPMSMACPTNPPCP